MPALATIDARDRARQHVATMLFLVFAVWGPMLLLGVGVILAVLNTSTQRSSAALFMFVTLWIAVLPAAWYGHFRLVFRRLQARRDHESILPSSSASQQPRPRDQRRHQRRRPQSFAFADDVEMRPLRLSAPPRPRPPRLESHIRPPPRRIRSPVRSGTRPPVRFDSGSPTRPAGPRPSSHRQTVSPRGAAAVAAAATTPSPALVPTKAPSSNHSPRMTSPVKPAGPRSPGKASPARDPGQPSAGRPAPAADKVCSIDKTQAQDP